MHAGGARTNTFKYTRMHAYLYANTYKHILVCTTTVEGLNKATHSNNCAMLVREDHVAGEK